MDPQTLNDGRPFGPWRYKEIVKECYIISKSINTSYNDIMQITPVERKYMIEFLLDEVKKKQEAIEQAKQEREAKKNK